jgi:hypothetical protein
MTERLTGLIGLSDSDMVSVTGGGGKSSFIFTACRELHQEGRKALVTSTALMREPSPEELCGADFYAGEYRAGGKAGHADPEYLDELRCDESRGIILNEADGAAMKPYKFYREYEPVIPGQTDVIVHVIGCEVFGRRVCDGLFHRCPDGYRGNIFDEAMFVKAMTWYAENKVKEYSTRKILLINKADEGRLETALSFGEAARGIFDACIVSSLKGGRWQFCYTR